jgi:hypothetical protein
MAGTPNPLSTFKLDDLARFTKEGTFSPSDSPDYRVLYVGRDDVHEALAYVLSRVTRSIVFNQFGYDDDALDAEIIKLIEDDHVSVVGTLDKSQAGGVHERKILAAWTPEVRADFAIGQSATHQISHTKGGVLDSILAWEGSTNWSNSGEGTGKPGESGYKAQNNTCTFHIHPLQVGRFAEELHEEHVIALRQEEESKAKVDEAPSGVRDE